MSRGETSRILKSSAKQGKAVLRFSLHKADPQLLCTEMYCFREKKRFNAAMPPLKAIRDSLLLLSDQWTEGRIKESKHFSQ